MMGFGPQWASPHSGHRISSSFVHQCSIHRRDSTKFSLGPHGTCCSCPTLQNTYTKSMGPQSVPSSSRIPCSALAATAGAPSFAAMSDTWLPNPSRGPATREPQYVSHKQDEARARLSQDRTDPLMPSPTMHSSDAVRFPSQVARSSSTTSYAPNIQRSSYDDGLDDFGMYCTALMIVALLTRPRQECSRRHHAAIQTRE
jgi:hypothetical protein